jgi:hypothetical protein
VRLTPTGFGSALLVADRGGMERRCVRVPRGSERDGRVTSSWS